MKVPHLRNLRSLGAATAVACIAVGGVPAEVSALATTPNRFPTDSSPSATSPSPTFGSAAIALSVSSGPPTAAVTIGGSGFPPLEIVALYLELPNGIAYLPHLGSLGPQADAQGAFQTQSTVPDAPFGPHSLCADTGYPGSTQEFKVKTCVQFVVETYAPKVTLSSNSGPAGATLTMTGSGFPPNLIVALYFDGPSQMLSTPGPFADGQGAFGAEIRVPQVAPGPHAVCGDTGPPAVAQPIAAKACATFVIEGAAPASAGPTPSSPSPVLSAPPTMVPSADSSFPVLVPLAVVILIALATWASIAATRRRP